MKRLLPLLTLLTAGAVWADMKWRNGNTTDLGIVTTLNCVRDGGLLCTRDAGSIGDVRCMTASATEPGCMSVGAQTIAGDKTFTGIVKTPLLDAGIAAVGDFDLRASTLTCRNTGGTCTVQANANDGTTNSSVAAMTFSLGSDINATDLGWVWRDSSGNKRLACTESGNVYMRALVTDTGAATTAGESFTALLGAGGISSGATPAGSGGALFLGSGEGGASAGGAVAGAGGSVTIASGAGGAASGLYHGGSGGPIAISVGVAGGGYPGGNVTITAGAAGSASADYATDNGGQVTAIGGVGGNAAAGDTSAGNGGRVFLQAGNGGTSTVGQSSGSGGDIVLASGNGGATTGGTGAASGSVVIDTGTPTGAASPGNIDIGTDNAGTVFIGRAGQAVTVDGYGVLTSHGTTVLAVERGSSTLSGGVGTITFATAFGAAPTCTATDTTAANAVRVHTPTTGGASLAGTTTDVINWICIGTR